MYSRVPNEEFSVCPDCTWEWVAYINKDLCKVLTEQDDQAKSIMDNQATDTCPRRKQAILETKKQLARHKVVKVKRLTCSVVEALKEIFPAKPHHEDYGQSVKEVLHEFIKCKYVFLLRNDEITHIQ